MIDMGNYLWYMTEKRRLLLEALERIPEYGKTDKSKLIEQALEEFIKRHGDSGNPQTQITQYQDNLVMAIPNIYSILDEPEKFRRFYSLIRKKEDYRQVDKALNAILRIHNEKLKEMERKTF